MDKAGLQENGGRGRVYSGLTGCLTRSRLEGDWAWFWAWGSVWFGLGFFWFWAIINKGSILVL